MRRLRDHVAQTYLDLDLRSLGLFRMGYATVLLYDLYLRAQVLDSFYTNDGLLPNHTLLWAPLGPRVLSLFYSASSRPEALFLMVLSGLCFGWLLIGYRTRLAQFASLTALMSLDARLAWLANGGDVVLNLLGLWTLILPLGERFSIDALLRSLREPAPCARPTSERRSVRSLACFALLLQFSAIYGFNAGQKTGRTWRDASAVHYTLHQDRIVKPLGVWTREHAPASLLRALSYITIVVEAIGTLAIISPVFSVQTRALALVMLPPLHAGFELFLDLGVFSFAMIAFFPLLLGETHWRFLGRRLDKPWSRVRRVFRAAESRYRPAINRWLGLPVPSRPQAAGEPSTESERVLGLSDPSGAQNAAPSTACCEAATAADGGGADSGPTAAHAVGWFAPEVLRARGKRAGRLLGEVCVALLLVATASEALHANPVVTKRLHFERPEWMIALVQYPRAFQAWRMFAPHAPLQDYMIEVDAVTEDGRHVDPYNQVASRVAGPNLTSIPPHLHQNQFFTAYSLFVWMPEYSLYLNAFQEWILRYHERTGRPADRIVSFHVFKLTDDSPPPGSTQPSHFRREVFLRHPM